ncbi:hypothetical protein [Halomonas sp. NCCP-2165]|nr:hypothetical protein [Halomonas sp. NCCP-2165]GKW48433.1 hypothetical protein NCCP2165_06480 [Halomonas sp. NCCP-2165]
MMDAWFAALTLGAGYNARLVTPPERAALLSSPKALAIVGALHHGGSVWTPGSTP